MESNPSRLVEITEKSKKLATIGELHLETERELKDFDSILPYKNNSDIANQIYSPRLYYILQGTCSCIDAAMKLLCEYLDVLPEKNKMPSYLKALNNQNMLTVQKVVHRQTASIFQPYYIPEHKDVPLWWTAYNDTKHDLLDGGVTKATLGSTMMATAGLLILLYLIRYSIDNVPARLLDGARWKDNSDQFREDSLRLKFVTATSKLLDYFDRPYLQSKESSFKSQIFSYPMVC